jgi:cysteine desulfurase / selenocysteine lyase
MSTPDRPTDTPTQGLPSPGISGASARPHTGPTVPDPWDSALIAGALQQMANQLFVPAVPGVPTDSAAPAAPNVSPQVPPADANAGVPTLPEAAHGERRAKPGVEPSVDGRSPGAGNSQYAAPSSESAPDPSIPDPLRGSSAQGERVPPFSAPLRFDSLGSNSDLQIGSLPLVDGGMHSPADSATPYWMQPSKQEVAAPAPEFQLDPSRTSAGVFDPNAIRREFPILQERVNGQRLVWLDNAATTQKPQAVIDRLKYFYEHENSNIHRAAHTLAARATDAYESARETVRRFINAPTKNDVVFVRGTTEGINLLAQSYGRRNVNEGDEIVITWLEHHANIVPWQMLANEKGAKLRVAPVDDTGQVILEEYEKLLGPKTKLVSFSMVSNALGTVTPAKQLIDLAHRHGAKVVADAAQAVSHMRIDVQALDCDFLVFSGHKVFAPTGIGAVYGKSALLEAMPPWQGGGNMIQDVTFERSLYQGPPFKFEAGTGNIADAIGLGAALDWLMRIGVETVGSYEHGLLEYATDRLRTVPGLKIIGTSPEKAGVISFVLAGQKTEEVGGLLDKEGIAVRSGHHCAQPILRRFGLEASVRASFAPYNTHEDIDALVEALKRLQAGRT